MRRAFWSTLVLLVAPAAAGAQPLLTVAERSDYKATAKHAEVVEYCNELPKLSPLIRLAELGTTHEGRKLPLVILADPPVATPQEAAKSGKLVVFAMGNIHAGEVDGKEALLMLMRDLALAKERPLLKDLVLLFVPNFNADGGDKMSKTNRTHQNGPPEVGVRENAQKYDLNRDYTKVESPEVRALVKCFNEWDPAIVIDMHTTNGSYHSYTITYDVPRHPACDAKLIDYGRDVLLPDLAERTKKFNGYLANYYGNFDKAKKFWDTYPAQPRYGTQYLGLRHRFGILCESYVYASYKDRVLASRDFARACFDYAADNKDTIRKILKEAPVNAVKAKVALRHKRVPHGKEITVIGIEGGKLAPPGTTKEFVVTYLGKCEATLAVDRPFAYLLPAASTKVIDNLRRHGVVLEELREDTEMTCDVYRVDKFTVDTKSYQDHKVVNMTGVTPRPDKRTFKTGTVVVKTDQYLGTLASFLLEPQSEDGLCTWNYFDGVLEEGADYPVVRIGTPTPFKTRPFGS
jgi:hypothetical protein